MCLFYEAHSLLSNKKINCAIHKILVVHLLYSPIRVFLILFTLYFVKLSWLFDIFCKSLSIIFQSLLCLMDTFICLFI